MIYYYKESSENDNWTHAYSAEPLTLEMGCLYNRRERYFPNLSICSWYCLKAYLMFLLCGSGKQCSVGSLWPEINVEEVYQQLSCSWQNLGTVLKVTCLELHISVFTLKQNNLILFKLRLIVYSIEIMNIEHILNIVVLWEWRTQCM